MESSPPDTLRTARRVLGCWFDSWPATSPPALSSAAAGPRHSVIPTPKHTMPTRFESRLQSSALISGTWANASTGNAHSFSDTPPGYALTTRTNVWLAGCTCAEYGRTSILPLASAALTRTWSIPLSPSQQLGVRKLAGSAKWSRCTVSVGGDVVASAAVRISRDRSWQWVPGRGCSSDSPDSPIPDPPGPRPRPRLAAHTVAKASRTRRRARCRPDSGIWPPLIALGVQGARCRHLKGG